MCLMKSKITIIFFFFASSLFSKVIAQDLLSQLEQIPFEEPKYAMSTFKGNRLSIGHSVETRKKGSLELTFMSRFWNVPDGGNSNFVADRMCARFGVDYAFSDRFTAGIGYGPPNGIADGYVKYRILRQGVNGSGSPLGITGLQTATYRTRQLTGVEDRSTFFNKTAFCTYICSSQFF